MSTRCYGEIINKNSYNYGNRCSLYCDESYCKYHRFQKNDKAIVVARVKEMLNECENAVGKENKKLVCAKIFKYLLDNVKFIHDHDKFRNIVIKKLDEFEKDWEDAKYVKEKLSNELQKLDELKKSE